MEADSRLYGRTLLCEYNVWGTIKETVFTAKEPYKRDYIHATVCVRCVGYYKRDYVHCKRDYIHYKREYIHCKRAL